MFRLLPEATAWQGEEAEHGQQHPEGQQGEDVQEGVHTQEDAKDHQLEKSHRNTCQCERHAVSKTSKLRKRQCRACRHIYSSSLSISLCQRTKNNKIK